MTVERNFISNATNLLVFGVDISLINPRFRREWVYFRIKVFFDVLMKANLLVIPQVWVRFRLPLTVSANFRRFITFS
ncbi:MAG: hypothetical protein CL801_07515 [Citromicrobium sp.]|nr:hypothetical protein [Citromicrobium sp.]